MGEKGSKVSDGDLEALKEAASDIQGKLRRVRDMTKGASPVKTMTQEPLLNQMEELKDEIDKNHSFTAGVASELKAVKKLLISKDQEAEVYQRKIRELEASNQELLSNLASMHAREAGMERNRAQMAAAVTKESNLSHIAAGVVSRSREFRSRK